MKSLQKLETAVRGYIRFEGRWIKWSDLVKLKREQRENAELKHSWWTPDGEFLALLRKDQLESVALNCAASLRMGKLKSYCKKELVDVLAKYFARTADSAAALDEHDQKGRSWIPGAMSFPARPVMTSRDSD
jgi:hypothetical protein